MGRIVFFVLLGIAIYIAWRMLLAPRSQNPAGGARSSSATGAQAMVSCSVCGLHLPRTDALAHGDQFYCCEEHRMRAPSP